MLASRIVEMRDGSMSLMDLEIIHRNEPINKPGDNKKYTFEINDNLLRFTFVYKNGSALQMLGAAALSSVDIAPPY